MKVQYTGKPQPMSPLQERKLEAKLHKLGKLLDKRDEKVAYVVLAQERHLHHAEIKVKHFDHSLVCLHSGKDTFTALAGAMDKLEKQILKNQARWRENKRGAKAPTIRREPAELIEKPESGPEDTGPRVFRVSANSRRKPMTVDEALLSMDKKQDYLVYRDAETDRVSVLMRRKDGNFDLVES